MNWSPEPEALRGRVAVVAGATRGAGRGIAAALGEAGATVTCTGRSTRSHRSEYDRAETIEETAELVTHLGGVGIAVAVDHLDADQVRMLAERISHEHGHINVLVNDIWGAEKLKGGPADWNKPIWQHDLDKGLRILRLAIDTHVITSYHLLPLLIDRPGGLLVEVTDGTAEYNASRYRLSVFYDLVQSRAQRARRVQQSRRPGSGDGRHRQHVPTVWHPCPGATRNAQTAAGAPRRVARRPPVRGAPRPLSVWGLTLHRGPSAAVTRPQGARVAFVTVS